MNEPLQLLKSCAVFADADTSALRQLAIASVIRSFSPHQTVYVASDRADSLCLLFDGRVALGNVNESGKRSWLRFVRPGELFGEQSIFGWPLREQYAEAFESSRVLFLPVKLVRRLICTCPDLATSMLRAVGERLMETNRRWTRQFYLSNRERLLHVLMDLADQYGNRNGDTIEVTIDLSHEDLAGFTGSTRESVSHEIGRLREAGLIASSRRRIILCQTGRWTEFINRLPLVRHQ